MPILPIYVFCIKNYINRYTKEERASASVEELKDCNKVRQFLKYYIIMHQHTKSFFWRNRATFKVSGLKVFGFQSELNSFNCSNANLKRDLASSSNVERMLVSTYGSFIADSLAEWSKQVLFFFLGKNSITVMELGRLKLNPFST